MIFLIKNVNRGKLLVFSIFLPMLSTHDDSSPSVPMFLEVWCQQHSSFYHFAPDQNISSAVGRIANKLDTHIHDTSDSFWSKTNLWSKLPFFFPKFYLQTHNLMTNTSGLLFLWHYRQLHNCWHKREKLTTQSVTTLLMYSVVFSIIEKTDRNDAGLSV